MSDDDKVSLGVKALEARLKAKEQLTPKAGEGYNVVGLDDYEEPGDELYLVANVDTQEEAEKLAKEHTAKTKDKAFVYGPPDEDEGQTLETPGEVKTTPLGEPIDKSMMIDAVRIVRRLRRK